MWHWNLNKIGKMRARYINLGKELAYINENNTLSIQVSKDVIESVGPPGFEPGTYAL